MSTVNDMTIVNQFGETAICDIISCSATGAAVILAAAAPAGITGALLTGLAAGANTTILATDTILEALAKLQAQIDAL